MVLKEAESKRLMKFLVNLTKGAVKPLVATTVFRKFAKLKGSELGATAYANRFENNLVPIMDQMDNYSIGSRIRVMFALSATVSNDFLELIETTGTVQVDEFGRISKYTSNEGKLSLEGIYCQRFPGHVQVLPSRIGFFRASGAQHSVQEKIDESDIAEKILMYSDIRHALQNLLSTISQ
nr:hypothetical protein Y57A10A.c - Caenorhabditis elegans [Caenorhabditis elegans]